VLLHYLAKQEDRIFSLKCYITAFKEFNQSLFDFFNFVEMQLDHVHAAIDFLNLVIN